jgi:PTS system nitrogen regulatory IIA component
VFEVMNRSEAARLLGVTEATLARWVRQGLLRSGSGPGERFERDELERWASQRGLPLGGARPAEPEQPDDLLASAVERGAVVHGVSPATASETIEIAVTALPGLDEAARRRLLEDVLDRECMASTGLGEGFALPHPRTPPSDLVEEPTVVVVFPAERVDWAALDAEPVHTVFLLVSPTAAVHVQILARVAHSLRSPPFVSFLRERPMQDALVARLRSMRPRR